MDPKHSLQDVMRCYHCETPVPPKHCDICHIHLCEACVGKHISDQPKEHYIVSFKMRGITHKCPIHSRKDCTQRCKRCKIPICSLCGSGEHRPHQKEDIFKVMTNINKGIEKDLKDLKNSMFPKYQEALTNISVQKADVRKHYQNLKSALNEQGESLHTEIDTIIQGMKSEIDDMDALHITAMDKQKETINRIINEIKQVILDLEKLLDSKDVCLVSEYTSRNEELRRLPYQFQVTLPTFILQEINREQIHQQIGSLSKLAITWQAKRRIRKPRIVKNVQTDYSGYNPLRSVSCLSNSELWTCGTDETMRLYNLHGELLKSVKTKSKNGPQDIALTLSGDLVYTDYNNRSINLVRDSRIQTLITLQGWKPLYLCSTSSDDLLVIMNSDDEKQTKVVRYSGSEEKLSIQWDDQFKPLYTAGYTKYLSENRNFDICVADNAANAVVVVSATGKLRFVYSGTPATKKSFNPVGIATDSQANILTSSHSSIHILNQDGKNLKIIDHLDLLGVWGLCVDCSDYLFVNDGKKVKKILYDT